MRGQRDLPVTVDLTGVLAQEVGAYVEGEVGWQVVVAGGPPRPVLALTSRALPGQACVVVVDGTPSLEETRAGLLGGALDVIGWPEDRERLIDAPARAVAAAPVRGGPTVLRVAGAAGGAGTSTVALAVAGLLSWEGRRTVVVGGDDLLRLAGIGAWAGPGAAEVALLDPADMAGEVAALARPVPGMPRLSALGGSGASLAAVLDTTASWPADAVVADLRVSRGPADVLVARPDAGLRAAAGDRAPVIVSGAGLLDARGVRRTLGSRPVGWLPSSARVARAGLTGRVPSALPGRWLGELSAILGRLPRGAVPRPQGR